MTRHSLTTRILMLEELAELGLETARDLRDRVQTARSAEAARQFALALARVARSVREAHELAMQLEEERKRRRSAAFRARRVRPRSDGEVVH